MSGYSRDNLVQYAYCWIASNLVAQTHRAPDPVEESALVPTLNA